MPFRQYQNKLRVEQKQNVCEKCGKSHNLKNVWHNIGNIDIFKNKLIKFKKEITKDVKLQTLLEYVKQVWSNKNKNISDLVKQYITF